MAVSVRMDPLLERELELAAKRLGKTKSQFIIEAVERSLGRKDPYQLMNKLLAEEERKGRHLREAYQGIEQPYDTDKSRERLVAKLKAKHGVGGPR